MLFKNFKTCGEIRKWRYPGGVHSSLFYPKALNIHLLMAGLLTYSLFECLPIRSNPTVTYCFKKYKKSLQQRVLFRIYTWFPFIPHELLKSLVFWTSLKNNSSQYESFIKVLIMNTINRTKIQLFRKKSANKKKNSHWLHSTVRESLA